MPNLLALSHLFGIPSVVIKTPNELGAQSANHNESRKPNQVFSINYETQFTGNIQLPPDSEISRIRNLFLEHLYEVKGGKPASGMFVDFVFRSLRKRIFARINFVEENQNYNLVTYEFIIPRITDPPIQINSVPEKEIEITSIYYFTIPLYIVENEEKQLKNSEKVQKSGFIFQQKTAANISEIPLNDRAKLPWIQVVSSRFFTRLPDRQKTEASLYLRSLSTDAKCVLINYQPFADHALKTDLQLNIRQAKELIREAQDLDWLLSYLNDDFEQILGKPLDWLLK